MRGVRTRAPLQRARSRFSTYPWHSPSKRRAIPTPTLARPYRHAAGEFISVGEQTFPRQSMRGSGAPEPWRVAHVLRPHLALSTQKESHHGKVHEDTHATARARIAHHRPPQGGEALPA